MKSVTVVQNNPSKYRLPLRQLSAIAAALKGRKVSYNQAFSFKVTLIGVS
jgi:hypothetical protein